MLRQSLQAAPGWALAQSARVCATRGGGGRAGLRVLSSTAETSGSGHDPAEATATNFLIEVREGYVE